jgi:ABC-type sulfate transport system permease component
MTMGFIWKSFLAMHLLANGSVFGLSLSYMLGLKDCSLKFIDRSKKFVGIALGLSGISGIVLLSILSHNGMGDLFQNSIGISVFFMLIGYLLAIFFISFAFLYKGGDTRVYRNLFALVFVIYLLVYVTRAFLVG